MNLFIETTLTDLTLVLFDKNNTHVLIKENLIKKSDALSSEIESLVLDNNYKFSDIKNIYITLGPGSFMGARAAYVYGKTFSQISNIPLFTISTTELLARTNNSEIAHLHSKNKLYFEWNNGEESIKEVIEPNLFGLKRFISNPAKFTDLFSKADLFAIEPNYLKDPTIGGA